MSDDTAPTTEPTRPASDSAPDVTDEQTTVPPGETPESCDYCGRPFLDEESLTLHRGLDHYEALSDEEREAFGDAYRNEEGDLRRFRIVALGMLVLVYFGFLLLYAVVT